MAHLVAQYTYPNGIHIVNREHHTHHGFFHKGTKVQYFLIWILQGIRHPAIVTVEGDVEVGGVGR